TADATAIQHGYQKLKDGFYDSRLRGTLLRNQKPTSNRRILSRQRHQREHYTNQGATMSDITGPAAIRAINALLEDHYPVDDGIWGQHCATCITDGGAVGADVMDWPCDIYATIHDAIGDQKCATPNSIITPNYHPDSLQLPTPPDTTSSSAHTRGSAQATTSLSESASKNTPGTSACKPSSSTTATGTTSMASHAATPPCGPCCTTEANHDE